MLQLLLLGHCELNTGGKGVLALHRSSAARFLVIVSCFPYISLLRALSPGGSLQHAMLGAWGCGNLSLDCKSGQGGEGNLKLKPVAASGAFKCLSFLYFFRSCHQEDKQLVSIFFF